MAISQDTIDKCRRIEELKKQGLSVKAASKQVGLHFGSYYNWLNSMKKENKKKHKFVDLVNPHSGSPLSSLDDKVFVVACAPDQLKAVIAGLK